MRVIGFFVMPYATIVYSPYAKKLRFCVSPTKFAQELDIGADEMYPSPEIWQYGWENYLEHWFFIKNK
ncbi:hypothetical protein [Acinetobacter sp. c1-l78]|uniref:hypothetical protein n=1 Tax=Acinetobacter sp. c1-l78 TaxID=3342803 RepID=UPI0035B91484